MRLLATAEAEIARGERESDDQVAEAMRRRRTPA